MRREPSPLSLAIESTPFGGLLVYPSVEQIGGNDNAGAHTDTGEALLLDKAIGAVAADTQKPLYILHTVWFDFLSHIRFHSYQPALLVDEFNCTYKLKQCMICTKLRWARSVNRMKPIPLYCNRALLESISTTKHGLPTDSEFSTGSETGFGSSGGITATDKTIKGQKKKYTHNVTSHLLSLLKEREWHENVSGDIASALEKETSPSRTNKLYVATLNNSTFQNNCITTTNGETGICYKAELYQNYYILRYILEEAYNNGGQGNCYGLFWLPVDNDKNQTHSLIAIAIWASIEDTLSQKLFKKCLRLIKRCANFIISHLAAIRAAIRAAILVVILLAAIAFLFRIIVCNRDGTSSSSSASSTYFGGSSVASTSSGASTSNSQLSGLTEENSAEDNGIGYPGVTGSEPASISGEYEVTTIPFRIEQHHTPSPVSGPSIILAEAHNNVLLTSPESYFHPDDNSPWPGMSSLDADGVSLKPTEGLNITFRADEPGILLCPLPAGTIAISGNIAHDGFLLGRYGNITVQLSVSEKPYDASVNSDMDTRNAYYEWTNISEICTVETHRILQIDETFPPLEHDGTLQICVNVNNDYFNSGIMYRAANLNFWGFSIQITQE